ncbi:MAG: aminotransferase class III-fold pyridoxal phosphate-dependent enzyme, partial [Mycobacterium sp.]
VMDAAHPGGIGGTYSGNPVACAAALGVFDEINDHQLLDRARDIGGRMVSELQSIAATTDVIGEIRGRGAMIAAELVLPGTREPHRDAVAALTRHCQRNGVLTLTAGTFGNVLRFLPPLTISDALLTEAFGVLREGFAAL